MTGVDVVLDQTAQDSEDVVTWATGVLLDQAAHDSEDVVTWATGVLLDQAAHDSGDEVVAWTGVLLVALSQLPHEVVLTDAAITGVGYQTGGP